MPKYNLGVPVELSCNIKKNISQVIVCLLNISEETNDFNKRPSNLLKLTNIKKLSNSDSKFSKTGERNYLLNGVPKTNQNFQYVRQINEQYLFLYGNYDICLFVRSIMYFKETEYIITDK
ncbi:hypothetical protein RI543_000672 [Arxiozyma heterogenica]|uniref:Uncharacterized protein n=1 Tax=Arxiozyma heterogenica TaxID=278026 RepID=A0AAN7WP27_9SACH|nr:hypothetical protein RI543_000672 [Kazachstania heterogenica]